MKATRSMGAFTLGVVLVASCAATGETVLESGSRFAELDGGQVHYAVAGDGAATIVFVHGWACDVSVWRGQMEGLAAQARLIALDLPGHGRSDPPAEAYSMDLFARAVAAVMDDAGVEEAVLVGHSNGTPVVRQFYRRYPDRTRALVVVDGTVRPYENMAQMESSVVAFEAEDYLDVANGFFEGMAPRELTDEQVAELREMMLSTPQEAMVGGLRAAVDPAIWEPDPIDCPLQLQLAAQPYWAGYEDFVRTLAPAADYRVTEGVSHFLMMDRPEDFNSALIEFLDANGLR